MIQKDQRMDLDEAKEKLKEAGVAEDEMAALEKQLAPPATTDTNGGDSNRRVGFVSAGVESQSDGVIKVAANTEDIELPEESDSEDEDKVEIAQKDVPDAVFGDLAQKRKETEAATKEEDSRLGALERIKRLKKT